MGRSVGLLVELSVDRSGRFSALSVDRLVCFVGRSVGGFVGRSFDRSIGFCGQVSHAVGLLI